MIFSYTDDWHNGEVLKADLGDIKLYVYIKNDEAIFIDIDGNGYEFYLGTDDKVLENTYVKDGDTFMSLSDCLREAEKQFYHIAKDLNREARGDREHASLMSSPEYTGRV